MIAQLVLTCVLGFVLLYAWAQYRNSPPVGLSAMLIAASGLYFVWLPEHATRLAAAVGIGRGADLVFYLWAAFSLVALLNLHLKYRTQMELITTLARAMALANAKPSLAEAPDAGEGSRERP